VAEPEAEMILKKCKPLEKTEKAKVSANLVNEFTQKTIAILDTRYIH